MGLDPDFSLAYLTWFFDRLWGTTSHMAYMKSQIEQRYAEPLVSGERKTQVVVHVANSFEGYYTYDGIDVCGIRVANEIQEAINALNVDGNKVTKLSVAGYSLGGLISRYALGLLFLRGLFDTIEPVSYTTFASPHVGVLTLGTGLASRLFNSLAPYMLAYTSQQLFLTDRVPVHKFKPLLYCMADPELPFYQALAKFKQCSLYANTINDHRTEFYTSALNSFIKNSSFLNNAGLPKYGPIVLDYTESVRLALTREANAQKSLPDATAKRVGLGLLQFGSRIVNWAGLFVKLTVVMPIWACCSITNSVFQSFSAWVRKRSFLKSDLFSTYHNDSLLKALNDRLEQEPLTVSETITEQAGVAFDSVIEAVNYKYETQHSGDSSTNEVNHESDVSVVDQIDLANPKDSLNLNKNQRFIIDNLNKLGWKKYPVHISKAKHSHAAIICRYPSPLFDEGKVVIEHWLDEVLTI